MTDITLQKVCRFCLEQDEEKLGDIFDQKEGFGKAPLAIQVMSCVSIEIYEGDEMPRYCCYVCRKLMEVMHQYKQICRKSDMALKKCMITGKLPSMHGLPMNLIECLSKELILERVDLETKTQDIDIVEEHCYDDTHLGHVDEYADEEIVKVEVEEERNESDMDEVVKEELEEEERNESDMDESTEEEFKEEEWYESDVDEKTELYEEIQTDDNSVFSCDFCHRSFILKQQLELHLNKHFKERNYCCDVCGKRFATKSDLSKHSQKHSNNNRHTCIVCNRSFAWSKSLKRHQQTHKDQQNHECKSCPEKFLTDEELAKHVDFVHQKSRPFPCYLCNKAFAYKQGLERHLPSHKEVEHCEICNAKFATQSKLQQHLARHTGNRSFPCKYCGKAFTLSHHLKRHVRNCHNMSI